MRGYFNTSFPEEVGSPISPLTRFYFLVFVFVSSFGFQARSQLLGQSSGFILFLFIGRSLTVK